MDYKTLKFLSHWLKVTLQKDNFSQLQQGASTGQAESGDKGGVGFAETTQIRARDWTKRCGSHPFHYPRWYLRVTLPSAGNLGKS